MADHKVLDLTIEIDAVLHRAVVLAGERLADCTGSCPWDELDWCPREPTNEVFEREFCYDDCDAPRCWAKWLTAKAREDVENGVL
jgi:hypothetical protein